MRQSGGEAVRRGEMEGVLGGRKMEGIWGRRGCGGGSGPRSGG